jgi:hypothetical protein
MRDKLNAIATAIILHWEEWEEDAGRAAQNDQDPGAWVATMQAKVTECLRWFLDPPPRPLSPEKEAELLDYIGSRKRLPFTTWGDGGDRELATPGSS